jgi:hypothetical protein
MERADLVEFDWDPLHRQLVASSELFAGSFPPEIVVRSHHTQREMRFRPVNSDHPLFDQDGWDGEQAIYSGDVGITLVLFHAF